MDDAAAVDVQIELSRLFAISTSQSISIKGFNFRAKQGIDGILPAIHSEHVDFTKRTLPEMMGAEGVTLDPVVYSEEWRLDVAKILTLSTRELNHGIIDSSTLVFSHSILDALLQDLLILTKKSHREYWKERVQRRKVELSEIESGGIDSAISNLIDKIVVEKCKESMGVKTEILLEIIKPQPNEVFAEAYRFDPDYLKEIDDKRHALVHKPREFEKYFRFGNTQIT